MSTETYFNPPYSQHVKTNVGKLFLNAINKCFPSGHVLKKVMNRNTIKISYRCMPNLKKEINRHNNQILKPKPTTTEAGCNCNDETDCPMPGKCLTDRLVYKATVCGPDIETETYTGVTKNTFKKRYYGHTSSFRNREHEFSTTLSAYIWNLKDKDQEYDVRWQVIDRGPEFNPTSRKCILCIKEKYHIIHNPDGSSLNSRSELFSTCRHRTKKLLSNI